MGATGPLIVLGTVAALAAGLLLAGLAMALAHAMHTGRIGLAGLAGNGLHSGQAVLVSLAGAAYYGGTGYWQVTHGHPLPPVPDWLLTAIGGSHAFHLGGAGTALFKPQ